MNNIKAIKNYILYLKNQCGLSVTLHPIEKENLIINSDLITFNIHDNPYCAYIKTFPLAQQYCVHMQCKVFEKCKDDSYCGTCYAGVREYVYPFKCKDKPIGFISVSGFGDDNPSSYMERTSNKFDIPLSNMQIAYSALKKTTPEKSYIDTLIFPLVSMLELAYINEKEEIDESWLDSVIRYIKQYHTQDLTLEELCKHFNCSRSKLSHAFKTEVGMGFREYITELRLTDAKSLLRYSDLSVINISYSIGFSDSNYFSNVFKKRYGISPTNYRKKHIKKQHKS